MNQDRIDGNWQTRWSDLLLRLRLFGVSYAPLFGIFALRAVPDRVPTAIWAVLTGLFLWDGYFIVSGSQRRNAREVVADKVRDKSGAVAGYLATYLLPFVTAPPSTVPQVLALVAFFAVAAAVYVRSDLALINPTLYLYGWRVAEISSGGRTVLLLCRTLPKSGGTMNAVRWLNVYVEKLAPRESEGRNLDADPGA